MISNTYLEQLESLHKKGKFKLGIRQLNFAKKFIELNNFKTILDYGCGGGELVNELKNLFPDKQILGYDPANPKFKKLIDYSVDAVISTDVFEHFEPEYLIPCLQGIDSRIGQKGAFRIACYPAVKKLPDGRNCHLIQEDPDWWLEKIETYMKARIENYSIFEENLKHYNKAKTIDIFVAKS